MEGQLIRISQRDSQPWLCMIVGKSVSEKSDKITWRSEWMPHLEKSSKKSWRALSSQKPDMGGSRIRRGWCPGTKRVPRWSGFTLGCHAQTIRERERERELEKYQSTIISKERKEWYVCMNMWHAIIKISWAQPNPNLPAHKVPIYKAHI